MHPILLALYSNKAGGNCLTHIGTEGGASSSVARSDRRDPRLAPRQHDLGMHIRNLLYGLASLNGPAPTPTRPERVVEEACLEHLLDFAADYLKLFGQSPNLDVFRQPQ